MFPAPLALSPLAPFPPLTLLPAPTPLMTSYTSSHFQPLPFIPTFPFYTHVIAPSSYTTLIISKICPVHNPSTHSESTSIEHSTNEYTVPDNYSELQFSQHWLNTAWFLMSCTKGGIQFSPWLLWIPRKRSSNHGCLFCRVVGFYLPTWPITVMRIDVMIDALPDRKPHNEWLSLRTFTHCVSSACFLCRPGSREFSTRQQVGFADLDKRFIKNILTNLYTFRSKYQLAQVSVDTQWLYKGQWP